MTASSFTFPTVSGVTLGTRTPAAETGSCVTTIDAAFQQHLSSGYWDWLSLYERDQAVGPLLHPDVVLTDLAHASASKHPAVLLQFRVAGPEQGMGVLVPKRVTTRQLGGFPFNSLLNGYRLAGNEFATSAITAETQTLLQRQLLASALEWVSQQRAAFLLIEDLDDASPLAVTLNATLPDGWRIYRHAGIQPRRRIALPETPELYWQKFSSKTRQTFRRKLKKFGRTHLSRIEDVSQVADFLQAAHQISLQTWQTRQFGLRVRNDRAELARFCELARLGLLRSYLWFVEDQAVAFTIGFQDHGRFYYEEVGYLPEFARFSPGQMMLIQMIDDLIAHHRAEWFDFGGGDADYKELFATHSSRSGTVWLFPPTLQGATTHAYLETSHYFRRTARQLLTRYGDATRWRQWVRYGGKRPANPLPLSDKANEAEHNSTTCPAHEGEVGRR